MWYFFPDKRTILNRNVGMKQPDTASFSKSEISGMGNQPSLQGKMRFAKPQHILQAAKAIFIAGIRFSRRRATGWSQISLRDSLNALKGLAIVAGPFKGEKRQLPG